MRVNIRCISRHRRVVEEVFPCPDEWLIGNESYVLSASGDVIPRITWLGSLIVPCGNNSSRPRVLLARWHLGTGSRIDGNRPFDPGDVALPILHRDGQAAVEGSGAGVAGDPDRGADGA